MVSERDSMLLLQSVAGSVTSAAAAAELRRDTCDEPGGLGASNSDASATEEASLPVRSHSRGLLVCCCCCALAASESEHVHASVTSAWSRSHSRGVLVCCGSLQAVADCTTGRASDAV